MPRLLVTGAAGFVAPYLIEKMLDRGWSITATDFREPRWPAWLDDSAVSLRLADLQDRRSLAPLLDSVDAVVHFAAIVGPAPALADAFRATNVNVLGAQAIFHLAAERDVPVLYMSTATLYGRRPDLEMLDENDPVDPVSHYDATKYMAEVMAASYRKSFGLKASSIRTSFVYGQGHSTGEYFVDRVLRGASVHLGKGGDNPCDFTYVGDLAEGVARAIERMPLPEPVYNISGGKLLTRSDYVAAVKRALPDADISIAAGIDPVLHLRGACRIDRARRDFGYEPGFDLETGIADWICREGTGKRGLED
jgi:nucleoside-diphosphate-sugar epimerase